jgi:hypothetical protein
MREADVIIIGAGVAGLACAREAQAAGARVLAFDKGRSAGGRLSVRRIDTPAGVAAFDHGAQYFTARDPAFHARVQAWADAGVVAPWSGRLMRREGTTLIPLSPEARYVGTPGMNDVVKAMADGLDVHWGVRIEAVTFESGLWTVHDEAGVPHAKGRALAVAVPAEQTTALLAMAAPSLAHEARTAVSLPCWAAMAAFEQPVPVEFDGAELTEGALSWVARNSSKPGRDGPETWVLQASHDWSAVHLSLPPEEAARRLLAAFRGKVAPVAGKPVALTAHRWRYAFVETAVGAPFGLDKALRVGTCGDWRLGPRVECAWLSGVALGRAIAGVAAAAKAA